MIELGVPRSGQVGCDHYYAVLSVLEEHNDRRVRGRSIDSDDGPQAAWFRAWEEHSDWRDYSDKDKMVPKQQR